MVETRDGKNGNIVKHKYRVQENPNARVRVLTNEDLETRVSTVPGVGKAAGDTVLEFVPGDRNVWGESPPSKPYRLHIIPDGSLWSSRPETIDMCLGAQDVGQVFEIGIEVGREPRESELAARYLVTDHIVRKGRASQRLSVNLSAAHGEALPKEFPSSFFDLSVPNDFAGQPGDVVTVTLVRL